MSDDTEQGRLPALDPTVVEQLTLDDELDDGLSFGEWVEALPTDFEEAA